MGELLRALLDLAVGLVTGFVGSLAANSASRYIARRAEKKSSHHPR